MSKMSLDEVKVDGIHETTLWVNPEEGSRYRLRATHLDGRRAPKVVLVARVTWCPAAFSPNPSAA